MKGLKTCSKFISPIFPEASILQSPFQLTKGYFNTLVWLVGLLRPLSKATEVVPIVPFNSNPTVSLQLF